MASSVGLFADESEYSYRVVASSVDLLASDCSSQVVMSSVELIASECSSQIVASSVDLFACKCSSQLVAYLAGLIASWFRPIGEASRVVCAVYGRLGIICTQAGCWGFV